eukprot:SAG25_NODE_19_length_23408_cov_10.997040_17_plen_89_part_00
MRRYLLRARSRSRSCKVQCEVTTENLVSQGPATLVFHQFQLAYCEHHGAAAALVAVAKQEEDRWSKAPLLLRPACNRHVFPSAPMPQS